MMITIKKEGIKKRGTIKKQISLFWIVLIISLFQIGIAYASNNHTFFKYKYYPSDESANFTSPGIGAFILQDLTSEDISGGNFSSTVQLFDDSYYLCHSGMGNSLCDYMKNPENSDDLSDYKIFFELYDEFDNITYGGTYRDENAVFQGGDGTTLVEQDYRNMTIGFCDPDEKSGDQCKTCKLGYDLSNEEETIESRTWDSETEECCGDDYIKGGTTGGPSMDYRPDFLYQHVDEPDFSEYFCERCPLGNDKENPSLREWNPTAHCCGDDANLWYSDRDHNGTFTSNGDGFNNYNDCAKLVSGKQYLCNVHETNNNNSKWHNAPDEEGDIIFLPCIPQNGMEAMSDGYTWWGCGTNLNCPTSTSQHQFTGKFFENEKRFTFIDGWKTSYFCTSPPNSSKQYTIYECQGDRSARSSQSGIQFSTGESFGYPGNKVYYCAYQTDTISVTNEPLSTLNTQSTLWTTDLDLTNKNTCEKAGFIWTGKDEYHLQGDTLHNFCCSEADDNETTIDGESYNDPEGNGICFRSKYQPNNAFVFKDNHTYTEVYVMNGTQHGCALDDQAALSNHCSGRYGGCTGAKPYTFSEYYNADTNKPYDGSFPGAGKHENDFLIDMKNKPNPGYQTQPSGAERECPNLGGAICIPDCVGKECGDDGCGGSCGETCGNGETCSNGQCCDTCQSLGYSCGTHSDGCDGTITCGSCSVEWVCHGDDYRKKEYCDSGTCITTSQQCSNGCSNGQCNGGGGGGGGGCFLEGTKIKTLKGETAIEKIQQGDIVYSYDTETNRLVENVVNELLVHEDYKDKGVILTLSNYEKLYVTLNHAFYSDSDEVFKQLKDFKDNELLSYYNKIMKKMESVTIKRIDPIGSFDIEYNLELEKEPRNYFANGVLVHNEGKGGGGAGDGNGGGTGMVIYNTKIKPIAPPKEPEPRQAPLITGYATYGTDQGILIQDHSYCDIIDKTEGEEVGKYYCSYEEKWEETGGENLTHLSFTEWPVGEGLKRAECCEPTQCWDEQQCIETQHANAVSPPFRSISDGYRCIFGEWYYSYLKYNWDNTVSGWCPRNDQCLVNPSGIYEEFSNPQCVDSETYLGDHYCEDGKWTSRTKFLALQLLSLMEREDEYTIYCDNYRNTLNNINYTIFTNAEDYVKYPRQERTGLQPFESANNFCIVRYGENNNIIIGTTINHPVNLGDPTNFLNVFEESATCPESGQTYQKCGSSNIYHNNKTNSIIFSKESLSFQEPDQNIFSYFDNLFEFIFNWEPKYGFDLTYNFIEDTKDFNKLYVSNQQQIIAITENVWPSSGKEHITVKYSGIGADVCDSIEAYDSSIGEADYLQCTENSGSHYVVSGLPEGVNMWPKLTSKLRPKS